MFRNLTFHILFLLTTTLSFAQAQPATHAQSLQTIHLALQRAYAAQTTPANTVVAAFQPDKSWQLALLLAARDRGITETLNEIKGNMNWGNVKLAVVLDVTPEGKVSVQKCTCEKGSCKKPKAAPKQMTLYVLYREGGINRQEKYILPLSQNPTELWEELLKNMQNKPNTYQTGIIIDAHASGYNFFYGEDKKFASETIMQALLNSRLHVDLLELHSCHMLSMGNVYQWTKSNRIDFVVASSDICTDSREVMYYRVLRFLQHPPRQAAISSVKDKMKILDFNHSNSTNNMAAVQLSRIRIPLQTYAAQYNELFSYMGTENMGKTFGGYFTDEYYDWKSLRLIVQKQRDYVQAHLDPRLDAFYPQQLKFIAACDELINALSSATLAQWCYSSKDNKVYQGKAPDSSGCLDSISTAAAQFWDFWS